MSNTQTSFKCALVLLALGLLYARPTATPAQTPEPPATEVTDPLPPGETDTTLDLATAPAYISELMETAGLASDQVQPMLDLGWGWGEVRLAILLAQQMAAGSTEEGAFDTALAGVIAARTEGKGFGQIAAESDLKVGDLVGRRKGVEGQKGPATQSGSATQERSRTRTTETGEDATETPDLANPPAYISRLMETADLEPGQVQPMLDLGWGWGEVRIATLLAQQMAAGSTDPLAFDNALAEVIAARVEGQGFGQIAAESDLKVGDLVGQRKGVDGQKGPAAQNGSAAREGQKVQAGAAAKQDKPGFLARLRHFFGFGQPADKPVNPARVERPQNSAQALQGDQPDNRVQKERAIKAERPERPDRPARPDRPEVPARQERPERPERPERGPHHG